MGLIQVDLEADEIADAMFEDGEFMWQVMKVLAERVDMGMMRDNAGDVAGQVEPQEAAFVAYGFALLSEAIKNGHNMATGNEI